VAHNAAFDLNIVKNEMHRLGYTSEEIEQLIPASKVRCTCKLTDYTRLGTLYDLLPVTQALRLHDARDDVFALVQIINFLASDK
jgi:DNA polymerase III epsilon subunit-like protein